MPCLGHRSIDFCNRLRKLGYLFTELRDVRGELILLRRQLSHAVSLGVARLLVSAQLGVAPCKIIIVLLTNS